MLVNPTDTSIERIAYWPAMLVMLPSTANHVLDFGCGNGTYSRELAALYPDATIVGVDIVTTQLPESSERCTFASWDGRSQLETERPFDLVVAKMVLHYLSDDDLRVFAAHAVSSLAPEGVISFSVPHPYDSGWYNTRKRMEWQRRHSTGIIYSEIGSTGVTAAMYNRGVSTCIHSLWGALNRREHYTIALDEVENDQSELKRLMVSYIPRSNSQLIDDIYKQMDTRRPSSTSNGMAVNPNTPAGREALEGDLSNYPIRPLP